MCQHYWVCEPQNGNVTSKAKCALCPATKTFLNVLDPSIKDRQMPQVGKRVILPTWGESVESSGNVFLPKRDRLKV